MTFSSSHTRGVKQWVILVSIYIVNLVIQNTQACMLVLLLAQVLKSLFDIKMEKIGRERKSTITSQEHLKMDLRYSIEMQQGEIPKG